VSAVTTNMWEHLRRFDEMTRGEQFAEMRDCIDDPQRSYIL
jgi:ribulose bisphosphate carboxylase small subunit